MEGLAFELAEGGDDIFVDGLIEVDDFEALGFEALDIGAGFDGGAGGGDLVVDGFLVLLHTADVVGEGDDLAFFGHGCFKADELGDGVAVGVVGGDAFFEEAGEFAVVFAPFFRVVLCFLVEMFEEAFGDDVSQFANQGGVLHGLAGDVEREIFAVDDAADEAHPVGEKLGGLGVDEDLFAVEGDAGLGLTHAHEFHVLLGEEEEGVDDERGVCLKVEAIAGGVPGVGGEFVEVVVLLVGDGVLGFEPDGVNGVDALAIEIDGEADEV